MKYSGQYIISAMETTTCNSKNKEEMPDCYSCVALTMAQNAAWFVLLKTRHQTEDCTPLGYDTVSLGVGLQTFGRIL
jgi:hypothetical protein